MSTERLAHLDTLINSPEMENFLRGVHLEAVHQVDRWGTANDLAKRPADWFWLVGYLAGKALHAQTSGNTEKALHHCISTAAALYNWHCSISGRDVRMAPGSSDVALIVDAAFPGEAVAAPETKSAPVNVGYQCPHEWEVEGLGAPAKCRFCGIALRDVQNRSEGHG